ncbi:MAG: NAD-dependent epimerase/dehydratase family protein [Bdellovibrionales bacterium]|nr:NAD-dependent epimerase/dehydratase family protein [Bdellovibrionales bacterium]
MGRVFHTYKNIDCVIHCAGLKSVSESSKSPLDYFDNNVNTISLLKIMAEVGVKNNL